MKKYNFTFYANYQKKVIEFSAQNLGAAQNFSAGIVSGFELNDQKITNAKLILIPYYNDKNKHVSIRPI